MNENVKTFFFFKDLKCHLFVKMLPHPSIQCNALLLLFVNQGKQSISLEPGGQFELSGAPLETLHQTCAEVNSHLYQVSSAC